MTSDTTRPAPETPAPEAPAAKREAPEAVQPGTPSEAALERDPTEPLKAEIADLKDRLLRAVAEAENLRKRAEREIRDAGTYAITRFAGDVLTIGDNLRRALDAVPDEARAAADAATATLLDGIEMTEREFLRVLERHGVTRLEPHGQRFDPNRHQAMFEVENADVPSGTVVQVMQTGYAIGERVLRPALVGVSKGGPKPGAQAEPGEPPPQVDRTA